MDPQPEQTPEHAPEHTTEHAPEHEAPAHEAPAHEGKTHASAGLPTGDGPDFSGALGAAEALGDSPYAPFILLAIAAMTVLGGKKAWDFWGERSERQHQLELKRLDIQAQQAGLQGAQPPPCQVKQAETEARLTALEEALKSVQQATGGLGGFDPEVVEEIDKRLKRVERAEKARREEERDEERRERKG
jgi:hypothetical protein